MTESQIAFAAALATVIPIVMLAISLQTRAYLQLSKKSKLSVDQQWRMGVTSFIIGILLACEFAPLYWLYVGSIAPIPALIISVVVFLSSLLIPFEFIFAFFKSEARHARYVYLVALAIVFLIPFGLFLQAQFG